MQYQFEILTLPLPSPLVPIPFTKEVGWTPAISKTIAPVKEKFCRVLETPLNVVEMFKNLQVVYIVFTWLP